MRDKKRERYMAEALVTSKYGGKREPIRKSVKTEYAVTCHVVDLTLLEGLFRQ